MRHSIEVRLYERKMIQNPDKADDPTAKIIEPISKMTESNKQQKYSNIKVINYLLQGILNDIYNSVDACTTAKQMWELIKRLMHGSEKLNNKDPRGEYLYSVYERLTTLVNVMERKKIRPLQISINTNQYEPHVIASRAISKMTESIEGESLYSVYKRLTTLVNVMERNKIRPLQISINTKFLNSLQPEWSKYVTMTRRNANIKSIEFDHFFDSLSKYEPHVIASRVKKAARNHDPLALFPHSNVHSSHSHAREIQEDAQEDKLTIAMMLLARAITQCYSTPTNNCLRTSSNTRNQAVIQDGRVDIQSKNVDYADNGNRNARRSNKNQIATAGNRMSNVQCYNYNARGHYARDCPQPKVHDAKYFREHMLLEMKDEAGGNLNEEENNFMLDNHYGDDSLEELNAAVIMMERIQPEDNNDDAEPKHDAKTISEVNASQIHLKSRMHFESVHEHTNHAKLKTVINTSDDDQIDSGIIFDDPYMDNNGGTYKHDSNSHDQSVALEYLIYILSKKAFKEHKKSYLDELVYLGENLSSHDRIVYKMGQSIQTIHTLGKKPNKVYDPFLKVRLGYQNPERLKKVIKAQPKMYDGERLQSTELIIDSPDSEETLEDVEKSRLKMKDKMIQLNYEKLNALYETFVPQQEIPIEQTYLSTPSTSNVPSELSKEMSNLHVKKMPSESKLLKSLDCVLLYVEKQKNEMLMLEKEKASNDSKDIQATMEQRIKIYENDFKRAEAQYVHLDLKMQHQKEKIACYVSWKSRMTKLSDKNNQDLLITISELKVKFAEQEKNVNTKFDKSAALEKLVCVMPLNKNKDLKATTVSKVQIKTDKSKPVTSRSTSNNEQSQKKNANIILWIVDSGCSKHMTGNLKLLRNFVEKFMGTIRFVNDNFAAITEYEDYVKVNLTISHVYYVKGFGHDLFSVGQFCNGDLEVTFCSNTCFVQNLEGEDLLTGSREYILYTISISEMVASSPVCLMSKAMSTKSWLWHRRFSHLNFGTINQLSKNELVDGLPRFKYDKDHLCFSCEQGKNKKATFPSKLVPSTNSKLALLHMDLYGPMKVESVNGKLYILVIVDDYSRYTWVFFLRIKDETPEIIMKFIT
ncbi:retrovirus-related pol polyprotein from transposon TNT 1-94 [Tanacetum coccineum]